MISRHASDDSKIDYLQNKSMLFSSLLFGDEIRYTDLIAFFIKKFDRNPFVRGCPEINLKRYVVHREKKHTDLWISEIKKKGYTNERNPDYELPAFLLENKLKSLPHEVQLKKYTCEFAKRYLEALKEERRTKERQQVKFTNDFITQFKSKFQKLKFYLLTPIPEKGEQYNIHESINLKDKTLTKIDITCIWNCVDYASMGENIKSICESMKDYEKAFFEDFANLLICFSALSSKIDDIDDKTISITKIFKPDDFFVKLKLEDLYAKYRAAQCAKLLSETMNCNNIRQWNPENINAADYFINNTYSNGSGLFEVVTKVNNEGVICFIIQYQNGMIRKGIVTTKNIAEKYNKWFIGSWQLKDRGELTFQTKKEKTDETNDVDKIYNGFKYDKIKGLKFYYTYIKVLDEDDKTKKNINRAIKTVKLSIEEVLSLMQTYIKTDIPKLN